MGYDEECYCEKCLGHSSHSRNFGFLFFQTVRAQGPVHLGSNFLSTCSCHKSVGRLPGFGVEGNLIPVSLLFALFCSEFRP